MVVKEIKAVDYSTGTAYRYTDKTGRWQSIEAIGGKVDAGPQSGKGNAGNLVEPSSSAASASPSSRASSNSKVGLLIPTTSGSSKAEKTGEPYPDDKNKGTTDSAESTLSPTSPSSHYASGSSSSPSHTGEHFTGNANKLGAIEALLVGLAGLVIGWLL
jgi:hypothetical protein